MTPEELLKQGDKLGAQASSITGVPYSPITSSTLAPAATINPILPQSTVPYPVEGIQIPELQETEPEKDASDLIKQIQSANEALVGQSSYRTGLEQQQNVEGLRKITQDFTNQLRSLQAEAEAIKISPEFEQKNTLTAFAEGERGRKLRDVGVRALIVGANLQAAQGNLATALDYVERAVSQKFDPIKEEITAKMANLDLILKSPEYSRAEKERALQTQQRLNAQQEQLEFTRQNEMEARKLMLEYVGVADAITLQAMGKAKTASEVAQIAAQKGLKTLGQRQAEADIARTLQLANDGQNIISGDAPLYKGLNSATATAVRQQVGAFKTEPLVQNFAQVQEGYNFAKSISTTTQNPADDQALIYALAKALDPGSVVREGEYATAQKYAQSWVKAYGKGVTQAIAGTGFLSQEARANIKKTIETKYNASKTSYDNLYKQYSDGINNLTGRDDGTKFLRDYSINLELPPEKAQQYESEIASLPPGTVSAESTPQVSEQVGWVQRVLNFFTGQ